MLKYRFYNDIETGKVVCSIYDTISRKTRYYGSYLRIAKELSDNADLVIQLQSQNKKDLKYKINDDIVILKNYDKLSKTKNMEVFRSKISKKINKLKSNKEWFKKNPKLIVISGVTVVLSATIAVSSVIAKSSTNLTLEKNLYSNHYYVDYNNEDRAKLSYEIDLECGSKLEKCQDFFENNLEEDNIINKYSECYGVDCNLIKAIAYQESNGNHNVSSNPCAYGIMQIENVHLGSTIQSYNFVTGQIDKIKITEDVLKNKEKNVQVGIMIYRNNLNEFNNNPILALQAYNFGAEGLKQVLKIAANDNNIDVTEFINDPTNQMWLDYRNYYPYGGDKKYTENVMQYCTDTIQNLDQNDNIIEFKFNSYIKNKKK